MHLLSMEVINFKVDLFFNFDQSQANSTNGGYLIITKDGIFGENLSLFLQNGSTLSSKLEED